MLHETQFRYVIPFYNNLIQKFPTLNDVANSSDDDLFKYWEGLGTIIELIILELHVMRLLKNTMVKYQVKRLS